MVAWGDNYTANLLIMNLVVLTMVTVIWMVWLTLLTKE